MSGSFFVLFLLSRLEKNDFEERDRSSTKSAETHTDDHRLGHSHTKHVERDVSSLEVFEQE